MTTNTIVGTQVEDRRKAKIANSEKEIVRLTKRIARFEYAIETAIDPSDMTEKVLCAEWKPSENGELVKYLALKPVLHWVLKRDETVQELNAHQALIDTMKSGK